jgi:hypothetical protein
MLVLLTYLSRRKCTFNAVNGLLFYQLNYDIQAEANETGQVFGSLCECKVERQPGSKLQGFGDRYFLPKQALDATRLPEKHFKIRQIGNDTKKIRTVLHHSIKLSALAAPESFC